MPQGLVERVVARWKLADSIGDPKALLRQFQETVRGFANDFEYFLPSMREAEVYIKAHGRVDREEIGKLAPNLAEKIGFYQHHIYEVRYKVAKVLDRFRAWGASTLFLALLQQLDLPPNLRKGVEAGAKFFSKTRLVKPEESEALDAYERTLSTLREFESLARQALEHGRPRSEGGGEKDLRAGPFRLINTGGFDDKTMADVAGVVEKAAHLMQAKGLQKALYGDIHVSNTLSKSNVLAFYLLAKDEMFVRANLRGKEKAAVSTVIHELGHRLEEKFLRSQTRAINTLHMIYKLKNREYVERDPSIPLPKAGDEVKSGRTLWQVARVSESGQTISLIRDDDPRQTATMTLDGWYLHHGAKTVGGTFITEYAKKSPSENFAEMVAGYCLGTLNEAQTTDLEKILSAV